MSHETEHPHGLPEVEFDGLFTKDRPVIFAYHGYPWLIHRLAYRHTNHHNFHVRGYKEEGTTTTPFDMAIMNDMDRFHLVMDVIDRVPGLSEQGRRRPARGCEMQGSKRGPTRASTARTIRRSPIGCGRGKHSMRVLVVNAGSSSLKLRLLDGDDTVLFAEDLSADHGRFDLAAAGASIGGLSRQIDSVGHRVVHGGTAFTEPVVIDDAVDRKLQELTSLAPLHQPKSLAGIDLVRDVLPGTPAVACFDTAFHANMPDEATTYAVPQDWRVRLGVRRFGFHGLSHEYASRRAAEIIGGSTEDLRTVSCHLGAGASLAAVANGRSVDTTMGFTPLEGLVMATRSGTVDPGLVTWLIQQAGIDVDDVTDALEHRSGLFSLAGRADMAGILIDAERGDSQSQLAVRVYLHRLRAGIASMASAMNGLDLLVFTGGVGENAPTIRSQAVGGLAFLGVELDERANASVAPDADLTGPNSTVRIAMVSAREDLQIASDVRRILSER